MRKDKYDGPERRAYPRISANFVVSYRVKEKETHYDLSQTKNVGQGGVYLTTNKKFDEGTQLVVTMKLPFAPRAELTTEVVCSKEIVKGFIYDTHVKFLNVEEDFLRKLESFIAKNQK